MAVATPSAALSADTLVAGAWPRNLELELFQVISRLRPIGLHRSFVMVDLARHMQRFVAGDVANIEIFDVCGEIFLMLQKHLHRSPFYH